MPFKDVQFGHPENLNDAISLAIEFEAFETQVQETSKVNKPQPQYGDMYSQKYTVPQYGDVGNAVYSPYSANNNTSVSQGSTNNYKSQVTCFYCKEQGHIVRECAKLKKKQEREQNGSSGYKYQNSYKAPQNSFYVPQQNNSQGN